jgi:hypothetical protein
MNPMMPSEEMKARLFAAVEAAPAPTRPTESKRAAVLVTTAVIVSLAVFLANGGIRITGRPGALLIGTVAGTAFIAAVAIWVAVGRGRAMLGRASRWLVTVVVASPIALFAWKIYWSAQFDNGLDPWPSRLGLKCLGMSMALGALPLLALLFTRRGTDAVHPGHAGMGIGVALGLAVATFVDAWCPVAYVPHLLLGHILPLVLLGASGLWLGRKILSP